MAYYIAMIVLFLWSWLYYYLSNVISRIQGFLLNVNREIAIVQEEIVKLKLERKNINMIDEFAKYARLDRKIAKLTEDIKKIRANQSQENFIQKMAITGGVYMIYYVVMLVFVYMYYSEPLVIMPPNWFSPLNGIINIPTGISGGVGVLFWMMCCHSMCKMLHSYIHPPSAKS